MKVAINYERVADDSRWDGLKDVLQILIHQYKTFMLNITIFGMWNGLFI